MKLSGDYELVDLTHTLNERIPTWTGERGFNSTMLLDYPEGARVLEYQCVASAGTHIDSPSHFIPEGKHIEELSLNELCTDLCVVKMSEPLQITLADFENYERMHGIIQKGSVVIGNTGWYRKWDSPEKYRAQNESFVTPSFHPDVGDLLLEREIAGIGIDTLSPDPYGGDYPLHQKLLGSGKFIIENLTNLDRLPPKGAYIFVLPLKIAGGAESPVRAIALVKK